jgi:hypothetical protein
MHQKTGLTVAAEKGDLNTAVMLINSGASLDKGNPLYQAIENRNFRIAEVLIKKGANVNRRAANGLTPLHAAIALENEDLVEALLVAGADPRLQAQVSGSYVTPLGLARIMENEEIEDLVQKRWDDVTPEYELYRGAPFVRINTERLRRIARVNISKEHPDVDLDEYRPGYTICLAEPGLAEESVSVILQWIGTDPVEVEEGVMSKSDRIKVKKLQVRLTADGRYSGLSESFTWLERNTGTGE